ncbi:MAG: LbtU family siderophore porin [Gammaproteobacteria bacterium]|nr:LbtU family siderophore porin [Gammaproteobacteria bacterium]
MKLKALCGAMILLGIFSNPVFGDTIQQTPLPKPVMTQTQEMFWYNLIDRNSDYTGPVVFNQTNHLSGFISASLNVQTKRSSYASDSQNDKGSTSLSITNPELYYDSQVNPWALAHVALSYNNDFNNSSNFGQMDMFFTEANVTLQNFTQGGNLWSKIGMQYLNFGADHSDLFTNPVTFDLYQTNAPAATIGFVNVDGFYGDAFAYNGVPYGSPATDTSGQPSPQVADNSNNIHGYGLDLGYIYGTSTNGFNLVVDYLADLNTTLMMHWNNFSNKLTPTKQIPGDAVDAYYHIGPWAFDASYVAALSSYDSSQYKFNGQGAKPAAYALEADYNFGTTHPQSFALGFQQTRDMLGMSAFGGGIAMPKTRIDFTWFYTIVNNMNLNFEIQNNQDYRKSDSMLTKGTTTAGTGNSYNYFGVGYKLIF